MSNQILNAQFALEENTTQAPLSPAFRDIHCEEHVISSFILLDIVVLVTYFYGVYLFARGETEYLFGLASHVSMCVCLCACMCASACVCVCAILQMIV